MEETKTLNGTPATVQIFWTKDYGMFRFLKGNRDLNELKIKRIMRSVEDGLEFFKYCPIMVNQEGYMIDGQHRFYVCKKLGLNVYYVIVPNFTLRQVAEMNNNASKWTDKDYLNCYIDVGIGHYKALAEFIDTYNVNIGIASSLLDYGKVKVGSARDDFRDGLFKVNYYDQAVRLMDKVTDFSGYCESYNSRNFIQAIEVLLDSQDYNHTELLDKLKLHGLVIETRSSYKDYLQHLEDLFNFRNSKRRRIY
jgi:hypothetical protein